MRRKSKNESRAILLVLSATLGGCIADDPSDNFNLKMEGITAVYFTEIKKVYLLDDDVLFIPLEKRDQRSLEQFIGDERNLELEFFLGEEELGTFTLTGGTTYEAIHIPFKKEYISILEDGGVKLKK